MHNKRFAVASMTCGATIVALMFSAVWLPNAACAQRAATADEANVVVEQGIRYGDNHPRQKLDLVLPADRQVSRPLPVIVYVHGGAWKMGHRGAGIKPLRRLVATRDYAGVTVGYRLSGDAVWPAQIHDCKAAIRWVRGNAEQYGFDADRIAVYGHSAGGHLVALLGTSGGVERLEGEVGDFDRLSSKVNCVVNFFGPTDFTTIADHPCEMDYAGPESAAAQLFGGTIRERPQVARDASPLWHVDRNDAAQLILHGDQDQLVPYQQATVLHRALTAAGVPTALITVRGGKHGNFEGPATERLVEQFLDRHLQDGTVEVESQTLDPGA